MIEIVLHRRNSLGEIQPEQLTFNAHNRVGFAWVAERCEREVNKGIRGRKRIEAEAEFYGDEKQEEGGEGQN